MMDNMNKPTMQSDGQNELATQNEFGDAPEFSLGTPKKKISAQTVVLIAVLVIGCGLLFGMRKMGMGPALSFAEFKIDYEPKTNEDAARAEIDRVLAALDRSNEPIKLPDGVITRNPFELALETPATQIAVTHSGGPSQAEIQAMNEAQRAQMLQQALNGLRIQSIMGGRVPLAKISNETYTVGDTVSEMFTIVSIEGRTVILSADGEEFELTLGGSYSGGRKFNK